MTKELKNCEDHCEVCTQKNSLIEKIEGMRKDCVGGIGCVSYECPAAQYNQALDDVLKIVREDHD